MCAEGAAAITCVVRPPAHTLRLPPPIVPALEFIVTLSVWIRLDAARHDNELLSAAHTLIMKSFSV